MVDVVHIPHRSIRSLSPESLKAISRAAHEVFPNTRLKLISSEDSPILDEQAISGYTWADEDGKAIFSMAIMLRLSSLRLRLLAFATPVVCLHSTVVHYF